jgi:hypothetical protein
MKGKRGELVLAMASFLWFAVAALGEDADQQDSMKRAAWQPKSKFQYGATTDPLEMLQQTIAANDALLAKQKDLLGQLAALAEKAEADKAAAHRSTSRGVKK